MVIQVATHRGGVTNKRIRYKQVRSTDEVQGDSAAYNDYIGYKKREANILTASSCTYERDTALFAGSV